MPTYSKTLTNLLPRNQWADFDKTWYEASDTKLIIVSDFCAHVSDEAQISGVRLLDH